MFLLSFPILIASALLSRASPLLSVRLSPLVGADELAKRQSITQLSDAQISAFKSYTFFASTAYCDPSTTINWSCGANCDANSQFQPAASGGDGQETQFWYVGFDPNSNAVVVAHQGTDPQSLLSISVDTDFHLESLDPTLFPGIDSSIQVHNGFADAHARAAPDVLSAVQETLSSHPGASVTMVGHSLGGALALLDSVFLPLHLPTGTGFKTVTYGMPRVGNQEFANYVDAHVTSLNGGTGLTHVNNQRDVVPIVPGRFLGFVHPSGEVHIQDDNSWDACPGQDNDSDLCSTGDVANVLVGKVSDHDGPYDSVTMGC